MPKLAPLLIVAVSAIGPSYAENKPRVVEQALFVDPQQAAWQTRYGLWIVSTSLSQGHIAISIGLGVCTQCRTNGEMGTPWS